MKRKYLLVCAMALLQHAVALGADDLTPLVTIKPAVVTLRPGKDLQDAVPQFLNFTLTNHTTHTRAFNNFYHIFWVPILLSQDGTPMQTGWNSDSTRLPTLADFPVLKPGKHCTAKRICALVHDSEGFGLFFLESGAECRFKVTPGHYKLCINYRIRPSDDSWIFGPAKIPGTRVKNLWAGWLMSNWIDVVIKGE